MEDFVLFQRAVLQSVEVLQLVTGDVEEFEIRHTVQASLKVAVLHSRLDEKSLDAVLAELENLELGQVAEAA